MGQQYCDMSNKYRRSTNPQAKDFVKCFKKLPYSFPLSFKMKQ